MAKINDRVVELARTWLGTPYHHQASVKGVGVDCIGLVRGVYRELYGFEPSEKLNYSMDWGDANRHEGLIAVGIKYLEPVALSDIVPGNVILIRWKDDRVAKHCMLVSGINRAIHAYNRSPVAEIHLSEWWRQRIVQAFAFPQEVK